MYRRCVFQRGKSSWEEVEGYSSRDVEGLASTGTSSHCYKLELNIVRVEESEEESGDCDARVNAATRSVVLVLGRGVGIVVMFVWWVDVGCWRFQRCRK